MLFLELYISKYSEKMYQGFHTHTEKKKIRLHNCFNINMI